MRQFNILIWQRRCAERAEHSSASKVAKAILLRQRKASPLNHCGQSVARSWKPTCFCRLLQNPGRLPKSPRMFLSLALYHNPLANSEPPKAEIVPRVFSARGVTGGRTTKYTIPPSLLNSARQLECRAAADRQVKTRKQKPRWGNSVGLFVLVSWVQREQRLFLSH